MMTKNKTFCLILIFASFIGTAYAQDDDSKPYMPYMTPQQIGPGNTQQQAAPQTTTTKKATTTKKKTTTKKAATTKKKTTTAKKTAAPKPTSLQQGIALMQQSKYEAARPYLLKAIQEDRNNPNAWYWYGVYYEKTGGYHQAQYFYSKAVTIDPTFEPLSRIVFQPNDSEKTPLWDPQRPARVYEIQTASSGGISTVGPDALGLSSFPTAPNDPEIPRVPVYTPPNPATSPLDGDEWLAGVYVPPSPSDLTVTDGASAVYIPPSAQGIIPQAETPERQVLDIPMYTQTVTTQRVASTQNGFVRADIPLYTPPTPEEQAARQARQVQAKPATTSTITEAETETERKTATVPASRVVRQTTAKKKTSTTTTTKPAVTTPTTQRATPRTQTPSRTVSRDTRPATPAPTPTQPRQPSQQRNTTPTRSTTPPPARVITPEPIVTEQEAPSAPVQRAPEYMPPVGQYAPDPGTVSDTPIPPVGQGSTY